MTRSLSPRQQEVKELLLAGHAYKVIARQLGISLNTAMTHARVVLASMGARTRVEAILISVGKPLP